LQKKEYGAAYNSNNNLPKDTYKIFEGRAYTKAEWEAYRNSLPWWKKIL
jgi:hypothetical protein